MNRFIQFHQQVWSYYHMCRRMDRGRRWDTCWFQVDQLVGVRDHILKPLNIVSWSKGIFVPDSILNNVLSERMPASPVYYLPCSVIIWKERKRPFRLVWLSRQSQNSWSQVQRKQWTADKAWGSFAKNTAFELSEAPCMLQRRKWPED